MVSLGNQVTAHEALWVDEKSLMPGRLAEVFESDVVRTVRHILWAATERGVIDYCNARFIDYTGVSSDALAARGWEPLFDPLDRGPTMAAWHAALGSGTPFRAEARLRRADGTYRWHLMLGDAARDESGTIVHWFGSCTDIEDQKVAEGLLALLVDITQVLSASLDPLQLTRSFAELVAPRQVTYCEVQLYDVDRKLVSVACSGEASVFDAEKRARAKRAQRTDATLLMRELSVVPIALGEEVLGWLICCGIRDDLRTLTPELASRLGAALSNANAYSRERRVATTFQRAALSEDLPDVPGLRFSALYRAAKAEANIGGDWYDAFRLPDGRIVLSIGDVAGSGLDAAVTMASVRQSVRTAALISCDPAAVLNAADRIVRATRRDGLFVTAFVAVFDPVFGDLAFANAGHPPPLLRHASGRVDELTHGDLPLGLRQPDNAKSTTEVGIAPGSLLVAYTDGLIEFERDAESASARLLEAVRQIGESDADIAQLVFHAVSQGRATYDDVAILAVSFGLALTDIGGERGLSRWMLDVTDLDRVGAVQREYVARLRHAGLRETELQNAELVFVELIESMYQHASGPVDVLLDVSGDAAVLHVVDNGRSFGFRPRLPNDRMTEGGQELFVVKTHTDEFSVERTRTGGSHARAVLRGGTHVRATSTMARTALF